MGSWKNQTISILLFIGGLLILSTSLTARPLQAPSSPGLRAYDSIALSREILSGHPYFNFHEAAANPLYHPKTRQPGKETQFYALLGILLLFAGFKWGFDKYFNDLINLFFRRGLKQGQLKQQLAQNALASLMFNVLFILVAAVYTALLVQAVYHPELPLWHLFLYGLILFSLVYAGKYFLIRFLGWIFNIRTIAADYTFLVFLVNKIAAIILLPLLVLIALPDSELQTVGFTLSWILLIVLLIYRILAALALARRSKSVHLLYFIFYMGAFELLPVLMISKGILTYLN
ncbi:hypothetical protein GCM10027051_22660 [Niabella terrae]